MTTTFVKKNPSTQLIPPKFSDLFFLVEERRTLWLYLPKYSVSLESASMMTTSVTEDLVRCEVILCIFVIAIFLAYFISDHKTEKEIDDEYPVDV